MNSRIPLSGLVALALAVLHSEPVRAHAQSADPPYGRVGLTRVAMPDSNAHTIRAGFGLKYYLRKNVFADPDLRHRQSVKLTGAGQ